MGLIIKSGSHNEQGGAFVIIKGPISQICQLINRICHEIKDSILEEHKVSACYFITHSSGDTEDEDLTEVYFLVSNTGPTAAKNSKSFEQFASKYQILALNMFKNSFLNQTKGFDNK